MAKTRNFKQHTNSDKDGTIKLKSLLAETRKMTNSGINRLKKQAVIDEVALSGILNSGVLGINESTALKEFFGAKGIKRIDEVNFKRIDESVRLLQEDWWDTTKNWVKQKKDEFVDSVKAGWAGVKKIWANFKDMIAELASELKKAFSKIFEELVKSFQASIAKFKSKFTDKWYEDFHKEHPHEHADLVTELKQLFDSGKFMMNWAKTKIVQGGDWEKNLISGNLNPKGEVEGDENEQEIAADAQKMAQEAYRNIFTNKKVLRELANPNLIIEGHLEDTLKNHPTLQAVLKWGMLGIKALFSPITLVMTKASEFLAKNIFKGISMACKGVGGPGVFDFAILTLMAIEVYEISHSLHGIHMVEEPGDPKASEALKMIASHAAGFAAEHIPGVDVLVLLVNLIAYCIMAYSIGTILYNLFNAFKSMKGAGGGEEGGEETGAENAGYKPKGTFRISEGKLIFVHW